MHGVSACAGHPPALYDVCPGLEPISTCHITYTRNFERSAGGFEPVSLLAEGLGRTSRSGVLSSVSNVVITTSARGWAVLSM